MKNRILSFIVTLVFLSACNQKECNDSTAVNFNQKEECLFCSKEVINETRNVEVFDTNLNSPFYNQNVADVIFERTFITHVGSGCFYYGTITQKPFCEIKYIVKNKTTKKILVNFYIEYSLNKNNAVTTFTNNGYYIEPNSGSGPWFFSTNIYSNLKDASIKISKREDVFYE